MPLTQYILILTSHSICDQLDVLPPVGIKESMDFLDSPTQHFPGKLLLQPNTSSYKLSRWIGTQSFLIGECHPTLSWDMCGATPHCNSCALDPHAGIL